MDGGYCKVIRKASLEFFTEGGWFSHVLSRPFLFYYFFAGSRSGKIYNAIGNSNTIPDTL